MKKEFIYQDGLATCIIKDKELKLVGSAVCSPEDKDMENELTGSTIAEIRANIKYLMHIRDNTIKPQIIALNHLCSCIQQSQHFNPKSYETKMIHRQLHDLQKQLDTINKDLIEERKYLREYIIRKDLFYKRIRAKKTN